MDKVKSNIIKSTIKAFILFIFAASAMIWLGYSTIYTLVAASSIVTANENYEVKQIVDFMKYQINIEDEIYLADSPYIINFIESKHENNSEIEFYNLSISKIEVDIPEKPKYYDVPLSDEIQDTIFKLCEEYDFEPVLILAMIKKESWFVIDVKSADGKCYGLMQIHIINHNRLREILGITDFLNPKQNIHAGIFMMRELLDKYEDLTIALMSYNAGETGMRRQVNRGITSTHYTRKIFEYMNEFKFREN